LVPG
jgi:hypothetical protein